MIDDETLERVAHLARLHLDPEEREQMRDKLSAILDQVAALDRVDVSDVPPMSHVHGVVNVLRDDLEQTVLDRKEVFQNAPEMRDDCFVVPLTVDTKSGE